jgi:hypothetical protein
MFAPCLDYVLMKSEWGGRLTTEARRHREEVRFEISDFRFEKTEDRRWGDGED